MIPEEVLRAVLRGGRAYDLSHSMFPGMPKHPNHPPFIFTLLRRHGDLMREEGYSSANELITMCGHTGTHIDGLGHVSRDGRLFGGLSAAEVQTGTTGLRRLGIETTEPLVLRGVLLDVASHDGVDCLPANRAITASDLAGTAAAQGVKVESGDGVLIRTGWARHWNEAETFIAVSTGAPGPDETAARWLAERRVRLTGSDTLAYERTVPNRSRMPAHMILIADSGIHILEMLNLEQLAGDRVYTFLLVVSPLKVVGATGCPVRPVAIA